MADPISIACAVPTLITFGIQAGKSLRNLIDTFEHHTRIARDLKADLQAFDGVLLELKEVVNDDSATVKLSSLKLPLHSCGQICQEFDALIQKCLRNTTATQRSVRDWSRLQLKSDEINTFRVSLSGYKSTIQVALGGINLRTSQVTLQCLRQYESIIADTRADLQEQLDRIEGRLTSDATSASSTITAYGERLLSQPRIQEEKDTIVKCLEICADVSSDIDRYRAVVIQDVSVAADDRHDSVVTTQPSQFRSVNFATSKLDEWQEKITSARSELSRLSAIADPSEDDNPTEDVRVKKCLDLCEEALSEARKARFCLYEDISTEEDSHQYIVTTAEDLISAKRVTTGARSIMVMGQMSDQSLQMSFQRLGTSNTIHTSDRTDTPKTASFERYGTGHHLADRK